MIGLLIILALQIAALSLSIMIYRQIGQLPKKIANYTKATMALLATSTAITFFAFLYAIATTVGTSSVSYPYQSYSAVRYPNYYY